MADTHLILHVKGTESETSALLREEVRAAVGLGKISQSQLIWRPMENAWKPVRELPDLIPPVEHLILHVKGTEAETRQLPKPAVREGISKGAITHSQLIWRPGENAWKQVRELPELLPSQKIAPAPQPARLRAVPVGAVAEEIIPEAPGGPVARAVATAGAPPKVKMPGATPTIRPQARIATPVAVSVEVPQARAVATPTVVPQARVAAAADAVPRVRVVPTAVVSEIAEPTVIEEPIAQTTEPVAVPQVRAVAVPTIARPRAVAVPVAAPRMVEAVEPAAMEEPVVEAVEPVAVPQVPVAVPTIAQPRAVAVPVAVPRMVEAVEPAAMEEPVVEAVEPVAVPQVRPVTVPTIAQPRAVAVPVAVEPVPEIVEAVEEAPAVAAPIPAYVPQVRAASVSSVPQPRAVATPVAVPRIHEAAAPTVVEESAVPAAVAVPQVRGVSMPSVPQPRAAGTPVVVPKVQVSSEPKVRVSAAPVAKVSTGSAASSSSHRVKEESTSHPLKALCIGLGLIIFLVVGANYLFVDRPLVSGIKASEFSGASVHGHLAAFVQPNAILIHIRPSKMIIAENFTKFLVALAHSTPANPISSISFGRVALTAKWTAEYSFSGDDWKQLAELDNETEANRKEFLEAHLQDAAGEPVMPESNRTDEAEKDPREKIWQKFVDSFVTKPTE